MKITLTCKQLEMHTVVEEEIIRNAPKVTKLLKRYPPDLAQLHGAFSKVPRKAEFAISLTLSLPTGTLHVTGEGPDVRASVKQAYGELETQLKKHQGKLRKDYQWKRKRPRLEPLASE